MAVGDIITSTGNSFQPAAGTEIVITWLSTDNGNVNLGITNGTLSMRLYGGLTNTNVDSIKISQKMGITNTWYFYASFAAPTASGFSGFQTK